MQHVDVRFVSGGWFLVATRWADKDQTLRLRFIVLDLHSSRVVEAHYGIEQRRRLFSTAGGGTKYVLMLMIVPPSCCFFGAVAWKIVEILHGPETEMVKTGNDCLIITPSRWTLL
jgi:hypothetical protein